MTKEVGKSAVTPISKWTDSKPEPLTDRLFVYGIFLDEDNRNNYGMTKPRYATVPGYATFGHHIVQAVNIEGAGDLALTGLTVDVDPEEWHHIDMLEGAYDRVLVETDDREEVYMYVRPTGGAYEQPDERHV